MDSLKGNPTLSPPFLWDFSAPPAVGPALAPPLVQDNNPASNQNPSDPQPRPPAPRLLHLHQRHPPSLATSETEGRRRGKACPRPPHPRQDNSPPILDRSPLLKGSCSFTNGWTELYVPGGYKHLLCSGCQKPLPVLLGGM